MREGRQQDFVSPNQLDGPSKDTERPEPARPAGVLVVDDEASVRSLLETALRQEGFMVWQAVDGAEAIELYNRHRCEIGVVLLDVRMPGLDGVQTLSRLLAIEPGIRCCFMTGQAGGHSHERLIEVGAVRVFAKPFSIAEVLQVARQLIEAGST